MEFQIREPIRKSEQVVTISPRQNDRIALPPGLDDPQVFTVEQAIGAVGGLAASQHTAPEVADLLETELEQRGGRPGRVLQLLGVISGLQSERLVLPFRSRLLAHADAHVRSRAALMIGRASRNPEWIARQLLHPDPRVQANAVEAGWGVDTPDMLAVLGRAAGSQHNRVAANALVGMYLAGDVSSVPRLLEMAERPEELFRLSARWAMGRTGDPRFLPYLTAAFRTDDPRCRNATVRAMSSIRRCASASEEAGPLPVRLYDKVLSGEGTRRLRISVLASLPLSPLNFILHDGSVLVTKYAVEPLPRPEVLVVGFIAPRLIVAGQPYYVAIEQAIGGCLAVKRDADLWWMSRYLIDHSEGDASKTARPLLPEDPVIAQHLRSNRGLFAAADVIRKVAQGPGRRDETSPSLRASLDTTVERIARVSGCRHLFVFADPDGHVDCGDLQRTLSDPNAGNPAIHVVSPVAEAEPDLRDICRRSGGEFIGRPPQALVGEVTAAYRGLLHRYDVSWSRAEGTAAGVVLRIQHPHGCAEINAETE